jgi:hypothetical protein
MDRNSVITCARVSFLFAFLHAYTRPQISTFNLAEYDMLEQSHAMSPASEDDSEVCVNDNRAVCGCGETEGMKTLSSEHDAADRAMDIYVNMTRMCCF